jgi:hypothetical protein
MKDPRIDKTLAFVSQDHADILSGMQPFTLTITDPTEAAMLFNAALKSAVGWNNEAGMKLAELLASYCAVHGDKEGLQMFMSEAEKRGYKIPKWFAPLHEYVVGIADRNYKKFKAE